MLSASAPTCGILLGKAEERIYLETAVAPLDSELQLAPSTPLLRLDRVVHAVDGRPVEWRIAYCNLGRNAYLVRSGG